jgi:hypothetical protein
LKKSQRAEQSQCRDQKEQAQCQFFRLTTFGMHILVSHGYDISTQYESIAFPLNPVAGKSRMSIDRSNKKNSGSLGLQQCLHGITQVKKHKFS